MALVRFSRFPRLTSVTDKQTDLQTYRHTTLPLTRAHNRNDKSISSAVFAQLTTESRYIL